MYGETFNCMVLDIQLMPKSVALYSSNEIVQNTWLTLDLVLLIILKAAINLFIPSIKRHSPFHPLPGRLKLKVHCRHLYTPVMINKKKAEKLKQSPPPGQAVKEDP